MSNLGVKPTEPWILTAATDTRKVFLSRDSGNPAARWRIEEVRGGGILLRNLGAAPGEPAYLDANPGEGWVYTSDRQAPGARWRLVPAR